MRSFVVTLPNQMSLECPNREEALAIYENCQAYFQQGVHLQPEATVIDAGAHIGVFASVVAARCQGNVTIHAFEPMPESAALLRRNADRLAPARVQIYDCALGDRAGTLEFAYHPETPMLSSAFPDETADEYVKLRETLIRNASGPEVPPRLKVLSLMPKVLRRVLLDQTLRRHFQFDRLTCPVCRLTDVIAETAIAQIDLLKVNVEKSEELLFSGIDERDWSIIQQVVIEVHDIDGRLQRIERLLRNQQFSTVHVQQSALLKGSEVYLVYALR